MKVLSVVVILATVSEVIGHKSFQTLIPNGDRVPNPCGDGSVWGGVGHFQPGGTGARNQFGKDLKSSSMKWTTELCQKDSDGDGRTNGEELGDPHCTWVKGNTPTFKSGLSHPGVCEPVDSTKCKQQNENFGSSLDCSINTAKSDCPALKDPDIRTQKTRFPITNIPPTPTSYYCMLFNMPSGDDYHLMATTPIVNNSDLLHHMILFGCEFPDSQEVKQKVSTNLNRPYPCGMSPHRYCQQIIGTWTRGSTGDCMSSDAGFRIGDKGYKVAALQIHWNNPNKIENQVDSSGMTLYYTTDRGPYDAAVFVIGQEHLSIPPKSKNIMFESTCPTECTEHMFKQDIYITRAVNHMHYLGQSQVVSLYRNGKKLRELTNDKMYNYDSPIFYHFDPPVKLHPGDEIRTQCTYSSNKTESTFFGAGTNDEMCYAFLTYYPSHQLPPTLCASWKNIQRCHRHLDEFGGMIGDCRWRSFLDLNDQERVIAGYFDSDKCGPFSETGECNSNCSQASQTLAKHPCLQGEIGEWVRFKLRGGNFLKTMDMCSHIVGRAGIVNPLSNNAILGFISMLLCFILS